MSTRHDARVPSSRPVVVAGLAAAVLAAALGVLRPDAITRLDDRASDVITRWARPTPPTGRVVIVDVDERSLSTIGQWPWRRDLMGTLVTRLRNAGASAIAFDIVFAEPDGHRLPPNAADRNLSQPAGNDTAPDPDGAFSEAIRGGRVVLGYAFTFEPAAKPTGSCSPTPLGLSVVRMAEDRPLGLFQATGAICNLPALKDAAAASGFLNAAPDGDGVLRRAPVLIAFHDRIYPSMALAAATLAAGTREIVLRDGGGTSASVVLDDRVVPLDGRGDLRLQYRGKRSTFSYVSAADVIVGRHPADAFTNKVVLVGATALGTRETVTTPVDTLFNGVEAQATIVDNLLGREFVARPDSAPLAESLVMLVLGAGIALAIARAGAVWTSLGVLVGVAAVWIGCGWAFSAHRIVLSPIVPTLGALVELGVVVVALVAWERGRANRAATDATMSRRLMVQSLLSLTEIRDTSTGLHSRRTQQYARLLATRLSSLDRFRGLLTTDRIDLLSSLAPLHDIGKVGIPDRLLNKPGLLTLEEVQEMRKHPEYGRDVIIKAQRQVGADDDDVLTMAKDIVYTHHERWDGHGYPRGLRGDEIPLSGRVVMLVDVYDALTTRRVYREPVPHEIAVTLIRRARGTQFDPAVVDAFVDVEPEFRRIAIENRIGDARSAAV